MIPIRGSASLVIALAGLGGLRLPLTALSVGAVQALLIDRHDHLLFRHLDLPLAVVIALVLTRPANSLVTGFVFGLAVDAFQFRLFGVHCLAYCLLGPLTAVIPVGGLRSRGEIVVTLAGVQALTATAVITAAGWLADGTIPPGPFGYFIQVALWSVAVSLPLTAALGGLMGPVIPEPTDGSVPATSAEWR